MSKYLFTAVIIALFASVLTQPALSQDCPVRLTRAYKTPEPSFSWLTVYYTNAGEKRLVATEFGATALDAEGGSHPLLAELKSAKKVKPGDKVNAQRLGPIGWRVLDPGTHVKMKAWVQSVRFEDGTSWKDDGTHACGVETE